MIDNIRRNNTTTYGLGNAATPDGRNIHNRVGSLDGPREIMERKATPHIGAKASALTAPAGGALAAIGQCLQGLLGAIADKVKDCVDACAGLLAKLGQAVRGHLARLE